MMNQKQKKVKLVVAGDLTIDWNIARIQKMQSPVHTWNADDWTRAYGQRGGAALLADLMNAVAEQLRQSNQIHVQVSRVPLPLEGLLPTDGRYNHSYAIWALFNHEEMTPEGKKRKVWRVSEFLGLDRHREIASLKGAADFQVPDEPTQPDIIVLDDAGLGFRSMKDCWPRGLKSKNGSPWIILKMAQPVARGDLWDDLLEHHADRLIVIIRVDDLRHTEVHISRQVSWERTAQDLLWELTYNPQVNALTQCAHTIVSFDTAGSILLSRQPDAVIDARLFFDPLTMEGEWIRPYPGNLIGYTSCLTAGITRSLILNHRQPDLIRGIQSGILAMRILHQEGYSVDESKGYLAFPVERVADTLAEDRFPLSSAVIPDPARHLISVADKNEHQHETKHWTILKDRYPDALEEIARKIVFEGTESALVGIPIGRFGKLVTIDRKEIESLRCISSLIREYCDQPQDRPLSIAVFGPPGSGKSFAVKQVAESVHTGEIRSLTFNLSQLAGPDDLYDALHQVRDLRLSGKIPLIFWDEFDSSLDDQPLGWLRYFLAPMQDGEFLQGQIVHPIGRCIFVFAGGTSHRLDTFGVNLNDETRRAVKLPDFISRLKGFLDILGPNRQKSSGDDDGIQDPYFIIRRAILLRSIIERNRPALFGKQDGKRILKIDPGMLHAFLSIGHYKHGARSMEAIVAMSQLSGKMSYERSALPSEAQLELHVDGREFFSLLQRMELSDTLLKRLARAAHDIFCESMRKKGYTYGPVTDEVKKKHSSLMSYEELPQDEKEQNLGNVRDIPNKLAQVGYAMMPARDDETSVKLPDDVIETLAEKEHERWMQVKIATGWQFAKKTDKHNKKHQSLLPWAKLPEEERQKDRTLVKAIAAILARAGYKVIKLH